MSNMVVPIEKVKASIFSLMWRKAFINQKSDLKFSWLISLRIFRFDYSNTKNLK